MQRTPETVKSVIIADKQLKSFRIALSVLKNTFDKDIITKALIDSRALQPFPVACRITLKSFLGTSHFSHETLKRNWLRVQVMVVTFD